MTVTLERIGWLYRVTPWIEAVEPLLTYSRREANYGGRGKPKATYHRERLFEVETGSGLVPAGLRGKLEQRLRDMGYTVVVSGDPALPLPRFDLVERLRPRQQELLDAVAVNHGGLVVSATASGKSFVIRQICRMYPESRIVVVTARRAVVNQLYEGLERGLLPGGAGRISGDKVIRPDARVIVTTDKSMPAAGIDKADLILYDEAHGVGNNLAAGYLAYAQNARRFGFTASPHRGDGTGLVMEAMFGPVIASIDYEAAVQAGLVVNLDVHMIPVPGSVLERNTPVSNKRWAYWRNRVRNKLIAEVANMFPPHRQLLIITETLEHANNLAALLPGWPVVHYKLPGKELDRLRREFSSGELKRAIATVTWREGVDMPQLEMLIRADGASGPVASTQIPGRLSRTHAGKAGGVLVDFEDNFNEWAKKRADARLAHYRRQGWRTEG